MAKKPKKRKGRKPMFSKTMLNQIRSHLGKDARGKYATDREIRRLARLNWNERKPQARRKKNSGLATALKSASLS
tara:strand:- start:53 stop:277 length:225 start_codon:yes stop_codon:yes gene_type:complete